MHTVGPWGEKSVNKNLDQKIQNLVQKFKKLTYIFVIFNNFLGSHQLCDLSKQCFFGDLEHSWNNLDQIFFWELEKNQNFWRISKNSHILASKNANNKFLHGYSHLILLYLIVSDFFLSILKNFFFLFGPFWVFFFFIPYMRGVAHADFFLGAVPSARFR